MTNSSPLEDPARAELAALLPLREALARKADVLWEELERADPQRDERLYSRALRCDRVVRQLDTRIRLAAELLARGTISPAAGAEHEAH